MNRYTIFFAVLCLPFGSTACGVFAGQDDTSMETDASAASGGGHTGGMSRGTGNGTGNNGTTNVDSSSSGGGDIVLEPDGSPVTFECDPYAQNCPKGEKCLPWANDGGGAWNATTCSPIVEQPHQLGEECMAIGFASAGADTCDLGLMCWGVDLMTNLGTCVAMCGGSAAAPVCEPEGTACSITNSGSVVLCLPMCSPLDQDCGANQGCYPIGGSWVCAPDASNAGGGYQEVCAFINVCDPGLVCIDAASTPNCAGDACCTELCEVDNPAGASQCQGAADGQFCAPWYGAGAAPSGFEDVGLCTLPT
ncbi:MAG: hypothetical protein K0V04_46045 [Deltaproteobacteria bacterium]|nr:hypothetical protein [Deltaproteobacteria bacterium]